MDWNKVLFLFGKKITKYLFSFFLILFGSFNTWNSYFQPMLYSNWGWNIKMDGWIFAVAGLILIVILALREVLRPMPPPETVYFSLWEKIEYDNKTRILTVPLMISPSPTMVFKSIKLKIGRGELKADWTPREIGPGAYGEYFNFKIPSQIKPGKYNVRVVAIANGLPYPSSKYPIEIKERGGKD